MPDNADLRLTGPLDLQAVQEFVGGQKVYPSAIEGPDFLFIRTLEGDMMASPGDYIIKGVQGECYPCKPDIFAKTYEVATGHVEDDPQ